MSFFRQWELCVATVISCLVTEAFRSFSVSPASGFEEGKFRFERGGDMALMRDSCGFVNTSAHGSLPVVGGRVKDARRSHGPDAYVIARCSSQLPLACPP